MSIEIDQIITTCDKCENKLNIDDVRIYCESCDNTLITMDQLHDSITETAKENFWWKDKTAYEGWENDKELDNYLKGVKRGFFLALWSIATFFGEDEFYGNVIEPIESEKESLNEYIK